ncbi:carboxylesterase family protein [Sphingomonas sp. HITSZ_GF]|uniref:carboxylesterase/lipase family protein n=1 Tax=Sphingomonas sp. HITSZ_GF TaxID=3037247 RepID=UPI00240CFF5C|nr:carboxylesterase family protein [Sphingomonas sp. HITSZ_GF]MDG2532137.1 carboxylesterase family protein [Sphingomonas sp. HITSZ_GF]
MRTSLLALALLLAGTAQAQEVRAPAGTLRGVTAQGVTSFKGIPYAAAPVGPLRWHAPMPAPAWTGTRNATGYGNDCVQARMPGDLANTTLPMSEDCLFLNVWTPQPRAGAKLAVMVYIHGGGFSTGSGSSAILDGTRLAARGVVVVTFNYRLGRFGFFATPALRREAAGSATGNWALMDQIAALQWVKRNIAVFGGDPANVTVFGESAGGESVDRLMVSPAAKGLFGKAIAASGGGRDSWPDLAAGEAKGLAFAAKMGVAGDDLAALRALPADKVQGGISLLNPDEAHYSGPMTDGRIVTGDTDALLAAGKARGIRYIVGSNSDELGFIPAPFLKGFVAKASEKLGAGAEAVRTAYGSPEAYERRLASDFTFTEPAFSLATRQAGAGAPTWLYRFGYVAEAKRATLAGASHATDVPYQFDNLAAAGSTPSAADLAAARLVADRWVRFAKTGDPGWPRFLPGAQMLVFGKDGAAIAPADTPEIKAIAAARDAAKKQ